MTSPVIARQIVQSLRAARRPAIVPHSIPRPDGDCLGSALALWWVSREWGVDAVVCSGIAIPETLTFLPGSDQIVVQPTPAVTDAVDLVVVVDVGDDKNTGLVDALAAWRARGVPIINIDHHATNRGTLGSLSYIDPDASSTCELVHRLLGSAGVSVTDPRAATCLLTGLVTDTNQFTNGATTGSALATAADLVKHGGRFDAVTEHTWRNKELPMLKLWGRVLERLHHDPESGLGSTALFLADLEECGVSLDATDGIADFLNSLSGARAILVLREEAPGVVKASIRTTAADVDVSAIARTFGGGGHVKAAGFVARGTITKTPSGWRIVS